MFFFSVLSFHTTMPGLPSDLLSHHEEKTPFFGHSSKKRGPGEGADLDASQTDSQLILLFPAITLPAKY